MKTLDSKFFRKLAKKIYDPKKRTYLRLCTGTLTNGPDPKNPRRKMHCGLGELYFQMTGNHAEITEMDEDDVIRECIDNCEFESLVDSKIKAVREAIEAIDGLDLDWYAVSEILDKVKENYDPEEKILKLLEDIPEINDGCEVFDVRSRKVAKIFNEIADILES